MASVIDEIVSTLARETVLKTYLMIVNLVLMSIIVATGTLGNSLSFVVLLRDKQRRATHLILSSLALFDTVFLLTSYCFQSVQEFIDERTQPIGWRIYAFSGPFIYTLGHATRMMRNWTVVLVSIERFIAVYVPLRAATICTLRNGRRAIATIIIVCALYNISRFFEMHIEEETEYYDENGTQIDITTLSSANSSTANMSILNLRSKSSISIIHSDLMKNPVYHYGYKYAGYCIFVIGGPVLLLAVLNVLLIITIKRSSRSLQAMAMKTSGSISSQGFTRTDSNRAATNTGGNTCNTRDRKISKESQQSTVYPYQKQSSALRTMSIVPESGVGHAIVARSSSSVSATYTNTNATNPSPAHPGGGKRNSSNWARKSSKLKTQATARADQMTSELTRICIVIILCYTLCELPPLAFQIVSPHKFETAGIIIMTYLQPLSVLFATLNSSAFL